jgi:uncharacterized protein (DUF2164 family)
MSKNVDEIFEMEDERRNAMQEMLSDYLDTVHNDELPDMYNVKKWAAAELIMFLAYYVGETHYEMIGILDECKSDLRERHHKLLNNTEDEI